MNEPLEGARQTLIKCAEKLLLAIGDTPLVHYQHEYRVKLEIALGRRMSPDQYDPVPASAGFYATLFKMPLTEGQYEAMKSYEMALERWQALKDA